MTTKKSKTADPRPPAAASGDNRSAEDLDGNKAGAVAGNKTPGPDEPAPATGSKGQRR